MSNSKTPSYDAKVKIILDATIPGERVCALTGEKWIMTEEEISWYKKFNVSPSKYSPLTRMRMLTSTFEGGQWWYSRHPETGKPIISSTHPATGVKVLPDTEWFDRDFSSTALSYDSARSIHDHIQELRLLVPTSANRDYEPSVNSIAVASFGDLNSYFMVASRSKNSCFGIVAHDVEDSTEIFNSKGVTKSHNIIHSERVYRSQYIRESRDVIDSAFLFDCRNCESCFGATNKRNRKYLWWNEQLSKDEWERRRREVDLGVRSTAEKLRQQFDELVRASVWPENFNEQTENCVGEYLTKCTDCRYSYYGDGGAKGNYWVAWVIGHAEENAFCADPANGSRVYYTPAASACHSCRYCLWISRCQECEFCIDCYDCEDCFGCVGLRKKKFHIYNKPYAEEEYWKVVDDIKSRALDRGEYGDLNTGKFATGYYPESGAVKYHLADLEFGKKIGAFMGDPASHGAIGDDLAHAAHATDAKELPDCIDDIDSWVGKPLMDKSFNRRFSLIKPEVNLYKALRVYPPVEHHTKRVVDLIFAANSGVFDTATCRKCSKEVVIARNKTYPDRMIYCRACYLEYLEKNG